MDGPLERGNEAWTALVLRMPRQHAAELAAELAAIGRGVESRRVDHRVEELRAFLISRDQAASMRAWAERRLAAMGVDRAACSFRVEVVEDGRWVERYQRSLRPFPFGSRFTVHPRGRVETQDGRLPLLLVPGRAFGTGEHATTQLVAEQLERRVEDGQAWLDLGCGSGILLLVALACGAREALGIEIDKEAVQVARDVLRRNDAGAGARVRQGGLECADAGRWDGTICNISTTFARMHVRQLAALPRTGGLLILAGILEEDAALLSRAFAAVGLREVERAARAPWGVLVLERN